MNILMLSPEPFFQPRGTPISVYFRIKALSDLGNKVDLITYPLGENKYIENLKILRIPNVFSIKKIKIGPSFMKIPLDLLLSFKAFFRLTKRRYDLIFSHEEAAPIGVILAKIFHLPHLYDMHSSLPQQLENFNFSHSPLIKKIFLCMEKFVLKNSHAIIVICLDLLKKVKNKGFEKKTVILENFLNFDYRESSTLEINKGKNKYSPGGEKIVLYTGNFQSYQGISLLLKAASKIKNKNVVFLLIGGTKSRVEEMKKIAKDLKIEDKIHFIGQVNPSQIPMFISIADVLISPRISGTNTPLKIYSYLKSGKPLVATNLWTHTQILNDKIAILVRPDAESLAEGLLYALFNDGAQRIGKTAKEWAKKLYNYTQYLEKIKEVLQIAGCAGREI